jgi:hypothetical protein
MDNHTVFDFRNGILPHQMPEIQMAVDKGNTRVFVEVYITKYRMSYVC